MKSGFDRIGRSVTIEHAKRSCLDKRKYDSRNEARDAAARNLKRYGSKTRPYRCTLCGCFHLTTKKKRPNWLRKEDRTDAMRQNRNPKQSRSRPEEG